MTDILPILPWVIASYVLIFICGYVWAREKYKAKMDELHAANRKWTTYDREGRLEK